MNEEYKATIKKIHKTHTCAEACRVMGINSIKAREMALSIGLKFRSRADIAQDRKKVIISLFKAGKKIAEIAEVVNLTIRSAEMFCYKYDIIMPINRRRKTFIVKRHDEIVTLIGKGLNTREIADKMGVRINTIYNYCNRHNLKVTPFARTTFTGTRYVQPKKVKKITSTKSAISTCPNMIELMLIKIRRAGYIPVYAENVTSKDGKGIIDTGRFIIGMIGGKKNILPNYNEVLKFSERL